jgi:hypothetical protein
VERNLFIEILTLIKEREYIVPIFVVMNIIKKDRKRKGKRKGKRKSRRKKNEHRNWWRVFG